MMKRLSTCAATLLVALLGITFSAVADKPELPPPGMNKYVLALWTPGMPLADGGVVGKIEQPDVQKFGGRVLAKKDNRLEIFLPKGAAKQLRKHRAVIYLQRIWMGEPLDDWDERHEADATSGITTNSDTNLEWRRTFHYDGSGNITRVGEDHYIYDSVGRLVSAEVGAKTETYEYDTFGNLLEKTVTGSTPVVNSVDANSNRLVGPGYDVAGNMTSRPSTGTYVHDALNMMVWYQDYLYGTSRRALYDADDERIGTLLTGGTSKWQIRDFEGRVLREFTGGVDGAGTWEWQQDNVYANGALAAGETQPWSHFGPTYGGERHYHLDHLGSVRLVTNSAGRSISEHDYYPFGVSLTRSRQEPTNGQSHVDALRFTSHSRDFLGWLGEENTQYIDYMHARYYDPNMGRFLSVDPGKDWDMHQPQSWNMYAYVRNNPINKTDPTGRWIESAWDIANVVIGVKSFIGNVQAGKYGAAALDAGGVVLDGAAVIGPGIPGGAGTALKLARNADRVDDAVDAGRGAAGGRRAGKPHTQAAKQKARDAAGPDCPRCGTTMTEPTQRTKGSTVYPAEAQGDHIIPKSKGGDGATVKDQRNIEVICAECNNKKRDRIE